MTSNAVAPPLSPSPHNLPDLKGESLEPSSRPLNILARTRKGTFAGGHRQTTNKSRDWEETCRSRWRHDKIVRSTHGVNCTGSCSWKIYAKSGIVTWETQQTDYPRKCPDLPNREPRGCARGASCSWYLYSANRVETPLVHGRLMRFWRLSARGCGPG